jgi:DNA mismatch repair protein MutL
LRRWVRGAQDLFPALSTRKFIMAIAALPQSTVHLLGSAQALTTPTSLVKELVDNALDAKALSIDIIISSNTIDKIEVRDNGQGIQQEDLDALGRRGHTSKLRSFDELKSIGGVSLGFRGEALASAVQLGEVTVTTRTDGEPVATKVKLKAPGGIDSRSRASHPTGTTVSVTKFMYKLPVRKQTFLKEASKTLAKIKELLQAYVLARPNIKFSFKVIKESKALFSYAPRPNDGIKEVVSQIFGKEAASQCISKSARFPERVVESTAEYGMNSQTIEDYMELKNNDFIVNVFLPKPDADPSKIGHGQYISVDSRPVTHEKNAMRRIVTIFNRYMKESLPESSGKTKSPFLRLDITCPAGSYDPNVEPAKNDVIFGNESVVLEAIETLFKDLYGEPKAIPYVPTPQSLKGKLDNFELLLARKPATHLTNNSPSPPARELILENPPETVLSTSPTKSSVANDNSGACGSAAVENEDIDEQEDTPTRKWAFDMSKDLSEEIQGYERPSRRFQQHHNTQISASGAKFDPHNSLNPWIIAKLTAPIQQRDQSAITASRASYPVSRLTANSLLTPQHSSDPVASDSETQSQDGPSRPRQTFRSDDIQSLHVPLAENLPYQRPEPAIHQSIFQSNRRLLTSDADDEVLLDGDDSGSSKPKGNDFVTARNIPDAALMSPPATLVPKKPKGVNRSFVPPMRRNLENTPSHDVEALRQTKLTSGFAASGRHNCMNQDMSEQQPNLDLEWSMDFEHRKELASRRRRDELRAATLEVERSDTREVVRSSPHKNRYNAAIATLEAGHLPLSATETAREPFKTLLPDGDPRAYLMRRQKSVRAQKSKLGEAPKMTRAKSNRLPLENVPENEKTHNFVLRLSGDMDNLRRVAKDVMKSDMYVKKGNEFLGLRIGSLETTGLASRVQATVAKWMERDVKENCEVEYMFDNLVAVDEL